jgi:hypothetical protein
MYLIGQFHDPTEVAEAIRALREHGTPAGALDVFSEEPVQLGRDVLARPSRMSLVTVLGAICAGVLSTAFISWSQHNYSLVTGGMPVFSFWATGVITFEMTMLGAIVSAFGWFLWESGLIRRRDRAAPVPRVAPGSVCLRVSCPSEDAAWTSEAMRRAGAAGIDRRGES